MDEHEWLGERNLVPREHDSATPVASAYPRRVVDGPTRVRLVGDEPGQWRALPPPLDAPSPPEFAGHAKDWLWLGGSIWTRLDKIIEIDMGPAGEASAEVDSSYDAGRRQELIDKAAESRPGYRV